MDTAEKDARKINLLKRIGKNVRLYRKEQGWSQERLANEADIDRTYLGYIENGKHNVSIFLLHDLAEALSIEIRELIADHKS